MSDPTEAWEHARIVEANGNTFILDDREEWTERTNGRRRWLEHVIDAESGHVEKIFLDESWEVRPGETPRLSWR